MDIANNKDEVMSRASSLPVHTKYLYVALAIVYVAFYMHIPVAVLPQAGHDDGLFFSQARNIIGGRWLGNFSQFTLMKGPGYGMFLALNAFLGIPVTLSQALLHVLATMLIAGATARLTRSWLAGVVCFLLILWHPALFPERIIRDGIYAAQVLLILTGILHFLYIPQDQRKRYAWAIFAGGMTAWLWLTREEGIWIVPGLTALFCLTLWQYRKDRAACKALCYVMSCFLVSELLCYTSICLINLRKYGTFAVVDTKDAAHTAALHALQRVRVGTIVPFVPVPHKVREEIYKISPTFATLRNYFEGPEGQKWLAPGCALYPSTCGDFAAGWFLWALRDAVASQNAYTTSKDAAKFFSNIAHEVSNACEQRLLTCARGTLISFLPAMSAEQIASIPARLWHMLQLLLCNFPPFIGSFPSGGSPEQLAAALRFLGNPRHTATADDKTTTLRGWYYSQGQKWFAIACYARDGTPVHTTISRLPSPDVAQHFHDPEAREQRFVVHLDTVDDCRIEISTDQQHAFQLNDILAGQRVFILERARLYIDDYAHPSVTNSMPKAISKGSIALLKVYRYAMPLGAVLGALAYLYTLATSLRTGSLQPAFLIASTLWCLLACRIAILVLADASSFPALHPQYMSAGFPLFCLALVFSVCAVWTPPYRQPASKTSGHGREAG